MELIDAQIPRDCVLFDTSDYHYGALNCARGAIREMIADVEKTKNGYLISKGDALECILPNDKRFCHLSVDWEKKLMTPAAQADAIIKDFSPIKKKILGWGLGNHEYKLINTVNFGEYIAQGLNVPYGGPVFKLRFHDKQGKPLFKTFHAHGSGSTPKGAKDPIQRKANRRAWLKRKLEALCGDAIYMSIGHGHHTITVKPTTSNQLYLTDNGKQVKQHYRTDSRQTASYIAPESRFYAMTASFLKLFSPPGSGAIGYGEMALFEPSEIGYTKVHVQGGEIVDLEEVAL